MAMMRGAPASIRRARSVSGKSASGSQPSSTRHSILPAAAALAISSAVHAVLRRAQAHLDRADDVAAAQRRQHLGTGRELQRGDHAVADLARMLGEVGPAGDDHHRPLGELRGDLGVVARRVPTACVMLPGLVLDRSSTRAR